MSRRDSQPSSPSRSSSRGYLRGSQRSVPRRALRAALWHTFTAAAALERGLRFVRARWRGPGAPPEESSFGRFHGPCAITAADRDRPSRRRPGIPWQRLAPGGFALFAIVGSALLGSVRGG